MKFPILPLLIIVLCAARATAKPVKVYVLAGDECVLEEGVVSAAGKTGTLEEVVKVDPA